MSLYRIKQFYWSVFAKVQDEELDFVSRHLSDLELALFKKLSLNEQRHSINVAKCILEECLKRNISDRRLIKAALLHDIGKIKCRLNVFDKSILVILSKLTKGKISRFKNFKKIDVYYNHGYHGYEILKKHIQDEKLLYLIKNHHNLETSEDEEMKLLRQCDNNN